MRVSAKGRAAARCPRSATAFLDGLVAQDFAAVRATLSDEVVLRALLPDGPHAWTGAETVADRFERWFGNTERFAAVEVGAGQLCGRSQLRWRLRLQAERLGDGWYVVEQTACCDADQRRINRLDLLCTGYLAEVAHD